MYQPQKVNRKQGSLSLEDFAMLEIIYHDTQE